MVSLQEMIEGKKNSLVDARLEYKKDVSDFSPEYLENLPVGKWMSIGSSIPGFVLAGSPDSVKQINLLRKEFVKDFLLIGYRYTMRIAIYLESSAEFPAICEYPSKKLLAFKQSHLPDYSEVFALNKSFESLSACKQSINPAMGCYCSVNDPFPLQFESITSLEKKLSSMIDDVQDQIDELTKKITEKAEVEAGHYLEEYDDGGILKTGEECK